MRAPRADRLPGHLIGHREAEEFEDRRRDVGREHVAVGPRRVRGEVAVVALTRDPHRDRLVALVGGVRDRDDELMWAGMASGHGGLMERAFGHPERPGGGLPITD